MSGGGNPLLTEEEEIMSEIIMLIVSIIGLLCSLAFLAYKLGIFECDSWEEAVKELLRYLKTGTVNGYYFLTDTVPPEKQVNRWILLSDAEMKELVEEFKRNLYILPRMDGWQIEKNGILRVQISAFDVLKQYQDMSNETYKVLAERIIQKFYFDIRNRPVVLFVESVTSRHIHFSIPLTLEGCKILRETQAALGENKIVDMPVQPLEEEVDVSEYGRCEENGVGNGSEGLSGIRHQDSGEHNPAEKN